MCCQGVSPQTLREQSTHSTVIWSRKGFQHFSDISRFLNFMVESPQTCLSSNSPCADVQVYQLPTCLDLCRCGKLTFNGCKLTPVRNITDNLANGAQGKVHQHHALMSSRRIKTAGFTVCFGKLLDLKKAPSFSPFTLYIYIS